MQKFKVAIARFPANGWERTECVEWLMHFVVKLKQDERISEVISIKPGGVTPIPMLRNKSVVDAKKEKADFLLQIDSDMSPDLPYPGVKAFWDVAWPFMLDRRDKESAKAKEKLEPYKDEGTTTFGPGRRALAKIAFPPATIAAPYCGPPPQEMPYFFRFTNPESNSPNPNFRMEMIPREMAAIMSGIQEMDAMPTGLILYDMRVFDILPPPWYRYEYTDITESEKATTEDVYQTRNAKLLGLPLYMAMDCWAGHVKTKVVTKPLIVTADQVHASLVEAVKRGVDSQDRLIVMEEPKANGVDFRMSPEAAKAFKEELESMGAERASLLREGVWPAAEAMADDDRI